MESHDRQRHNGSKHMIMKRSNSYGTVYVIVGRIKIYLFFQTFKALVTVALADTMTTGYELLTDTVHT